MPGVPPLCEPLRDHRRTKGWDGCGTQGPAARLWGRKSEKGRNKEISTVENLSLLLEVYGGTTEDENKWSSEIVICPLIIPGQIQRSLLKHKTTTKMFDVKAWAEYVVEWAAKDPYGFLTTVILALTPLFLASAVLSWKLAKMIEAREKEQKKKQKRQENIAKAKRLKKD